MAKTIPGLLSASEVGALLGQRLKDLRLRAGFKRTTLANRAGVSARSLQRFEDGGEASLKNFLRLVDAMGRLMELAELLQAPKARSIAELEAHDRAPAPKRGRI